MTVALRLERYEAEMLRRLLSGADATTIRRDGSELPDRILRQLTIAVESAEEAEARSRDQAREFADELIPMLVEAEAAGTYVRSTFSIPHSWQKAEELDAYVVPTIKLHALPWAPALNLLAAEGLVTQTVMEESEDHVHAIGYRLRSSRDERHWVNVRDLYAEADRCQVCGATRAVAEDVSCLGSTRSHNLVPRKG